jgi:ABC-2 type transport system permease protein
MTQKVFAFEFGRIIRRAPYLLTTFGLPALGALIMGFIVILSRAQTFTNTQQTAQQFNLLYPIAIVDKQGLLANPPLASPFYNWVTVYREQADGENALRQDAVSALYVLGDDYLATGTVTLIIQRFSPNTLEDHSLFNAYLIEGLGKGAEPLLLARLQAPLMRLEVNRLQSDGTTRASDNAGGDFIVVYFFAVLLMISTFSASGYLLQSVGGEKENRTLEILLTSVKPYPLLLGKTLAAGTAGLLQVMVWLAVGIGLALAVTPSLPDLQLTINPLSVVLAGLYFLLAYGMVGGVFAVCGALTRTIREGSQWAGWIIFFVIAPLLALNEFLQNPNGELATGLSLFPPTAPLAMVMRAALGAVPAWQIGLSVAGVALSAAFMVGLAGRVFRGGVLLRGKRPTLSGVWEILVRRA